jgi:hypothetical protein
MSRPKRNIRIPDKVMQYLQMFANEAETISAVVERYGEEKLFDIGELQEGQYESAMWIAEKLIELCNIKGIVDKKYLQEEDDYFLKEE